MSMLRTARDRQIIDYLPLVERVVHRISRKIPDTMDGEALLGAGMIGLIHAVDHFDEGKGVSFEAYARIRIKGAVQDELRALDHLTRDQRKLARSVVDARDALRRELGREADDRELAERADLSLAEIQQGDLHQFGPQSFDPFVMDETVTRSPWQEAQSTESAVEDKQRLEMIRDVLERMPERDQLVMALYYTEDLNLAEIGAILEVSQSRVSQIIARIKRRIREQLDLA